MASKRSEIIKLSLIEAEDLLMKGDVEAIFDAVVTIRRGAKCLVRRGAAHNMRIARAGPGDGTS
ncbi:MAG: hypothetical protein QW359_00170 [Metallosphaera sp.]